MKLVCLSNNPSKPCFVLYFKGVTLMLDCGLDLTQILSFLPLPLVCGSRLSQLSDWLLATEKFGKQGEELSKELKECSGRVFVNGVLEFSPPETRIVDLSQVDVILLSNSSCMLALPYITEYTGFKGSIYCTDPTLQIGKQYMKEMVTYVDRVPRTKACSLWKNDNIIKSLPLPLRDAINPKVWKKCYTLQDIESCLSRVQVVGFNEKKNIFGALTATSCSSGYSLGSCNWVIHSDYEKICYVSGSSTLTTHPKPIDQAPLRHSDVLIMSSLTQTPLTNPDSMIGEFCVNAAATIKNGGNVLVPCYPSGVTYDLFECLSGHLDSCGLSTVPMYFISPVSDSTLAYSNIFGEWLSSSKQSKVYLPEPPFPHAELVSLGRLRHYKNIHDMQNDFKCPCIVFTGHPSLRMGDVIHFIELWGKSATNTIIFTEPDFPYLEALGPFQPLQMRVCYRPIDTSLSFSQANKLVKDLRPQHLVVAESYTVPPVNVSQRPDLVISSESSPITYKQGEVITLPVKRKFECIELDPSLAALLVPVEIRPGSAISMVNASLVVKDNKYVLEPLSGPEMKKTRTGNKPVKPKSYIFGSLNTKVFVDTLSKQGITDIKLEDSDDGSIIHLPNDDTLIQVEQGSTHIMCGGDETVRIKIRDTLLQCLQKL
ncbi:integrator complex subunit 9-like [Ruditapes philippinarum]|uniref:integrator complex subunit 9-like n=1 Tax=Ruditapes philippinarum TaxID=129788 RepID=UPI00295C0A66|nr:integrator complex subunit 9-like [Ruditapes philippinarum]